MKKKMNKLFGVVALIAAIAFWTGPTWAAQIVSKSTDQSIAFRVYNGYTGELSIVMSSGATLVTNSVTCDGLTTTFSVRTNGSTTVSDLTDDIAACTNKSGTASLIVDTDPSLATDTLNMLAGTYTAAAGKWVDVLWDTSTCKHYDLYLPDRQYVTGVAPYILKMVNCVPGGTGDATAYIYKGGTEVARKVITSPVYVNPATWMTPYAAGTTDVSAVYTNSFTADNNVTLDWLLNMPFTGKDAVIVRVTRGTTATTGIIGAVIEEP